MRNVLFYILSLMCIESAGQQSTDSSMTSKPFPVQVYYEALGEQSPLYNGREYVDYAGTIQIGHPFFQSTEFVTGRIHFDGMDFRGARILYDIIKDKLLLLHFNNVFKIDLDVKKIREFTFMDHHFIRVLPDSSSDMEEGFYDRLYAGKTSLFVRRKKLLREERSGTEINRVVDEKNLYYIHKAGSFQQVKNMKDLLRVLAERKDEIRQEVKKNGLKFRKNREAVILLAVKYYDR